MDAKHVHAIGSAVVIHMRLFHFILCSNWQVKPTKVYIIVIISSDESFSYFVLDSRHFLYENPQNARVGIHCNKCKHAPCFLGLILSCSIWDIELTKPLVPHRLQWIALHSVWQECFKHKWFHGLATKLLFSRRCGQSESVTLITFIYMHKHCYKHMLWLIFLLNPSGLKRSSSFSPSARLNYGIGAPFKKNKIKRKKCLL